MVVHTRGFALPRTYGVPVSENARLARVANEAPRIPWDTFLRENFRWKNGEHVGLIGPTGQGKTTMLVNLLELHKFVAVFATKPRDETMDGLIRKGYVKLDRWKSMDPDDYPRRVLWPNARDINSDDIQKEVFHDAFARIYREGFWTVALDELWWFDNILGLGRDVKTYLLQARSLGISLISGMQRPAWVPREIYTSCTHLFFWRVEEEQDLKSLSGIGSRSSAVIADVVSNLEPFQTLYINTRTGFMCRTRCPDVPAAHGKEVKK